MSLIRTRWAAIGAAVAITLGAGGLTTANAANGSGNRDTYTAIPSCRVADTRPSSAVGPRTTPLGPADTHTITVTGTNGQCTDIPTDITAIALNITALNATQRTHLTIWPDGPLPNASSLNPAPGQPPTPNAVTTKTAGNGTFKIHNNSGNVDLIVDIVGYYQDHHHDDRYYRKDEVDALLASNHPLAASTGVGTRCSADGTADGGPRAGQYDACSSEITLGSAGTHAVLLVAQIGWGTYQTTTSGKGACRLERNGVAIPGSEVTMGEQAKTTEESNAGGINNRRLNFAGVTVVSGPNTGDATYRVACREIVGDFQFNEISLSGIVTSL